MRLRRLLTVLLTLALALTAAPAVAAEADGHGRARGAPVYLALGDSVAAGVGAPIPPLGYVGRLSWLLRRDLDCSPRANWWAQRGCRQLRLTNLAVSGATTTTLIRDQLPAAEALLVARNSDRNPRNDVKVVTLTIGGNDLFGPVVSACILELAPCAPTVAGVFTSYAANLAQVLARLRAAGGSDVVIVTTAYYNPLPACFLAPYAGLGDAVLEGGTAPRLGTLPYGFNDVTRQVSAQYGALVADAFGRLGVDDLVGGLDCLHPDRSGHRALARIFDATITG